MSLLGDASTSLSPPLAPALGVPMDISTAAASSVEVALPISGASRANLPPPPAHELLGHENLFNYFRLSRWSKAHLKAPLSAYLDASLRDAGLPLLAGPTQVDGAPVERDPNYSLTAYAYQAPPGPLQPRELSSKLRGVLTFSSAPSRNNTNAGPLGARTRLVQLLDSRAALLAQEERTQRKERKRRKKEDQARAAAEAATAAAAAPPAAAAPGENRITLSIKKRKAEEGSESGNEERKKKKQELVV